MRYMCTYQGLCTISYIVCQGLTYRLKRLSDSWILQGGRASGTWTSKDKNGMRVMHYLLSYGYYAVYYDVCYDMGGIEFQETQPPRSVIR